MIMANGSPSLFEWQFDDFDDGFDVTAVDDELLDFESVFNSVGEQSENPLADPPSSTEPCNESASHGAYEHFETHNSSLAFSFLHHSEASTSMAYYPDGSRDTSADWPIPANVGTDFEIFNHSEASTSMSVPDFSSFYNHGTVGTNFERANTNDTFGFTNGSYGNHQLKDTTGIIDGMLYDSVRNSHQALEILGDVEAPMNLFGGYSDSLYPNHEFSMPCITGTNEPLYVGSLSSNHNDGMLINVNSESEEHLMQNLLRNHAINNFGPHGPHASAETSQADKESTSGYHGLHMCTMSNKKQLVRAKNEKHVPTLGTTCKKRTNGKSTSTSPKKPRKKAKLNTNDEKSGYQFPSQEFAHQKSGLSLPDNGLAVPLLRHQRIALSWMSKRETKSTRCCGGILADDQVSIHIPF